MENAEKVVDEHNQSEDENEMNLLNTRKKVRVRAKILDSDSEEEAPSVVNNTVDENAVTERTSNVGKKRYALIDSDSEGEIAVTKNISYEGSSEADEDVLPHNKSFPDEETAVQNQNVIFTANAKGELAQETKNVKKSLADLYDSESEDETQYNGDMDEVENEEIVQPKVYRKLKSKEKQPKMTSKDAAKQRIEIRSESQRMLRESNVSLPYHVPKSYNIKEFLQKRSKLPSIAASVPQARPSVAIKMPKEVLEEVSKKFDERIKVVEVFYKSESDDEEENSELAGEIKGWLEELVDKAMNEVDSKNMLALTEKESEESCQTKENDSMEFDFNLDDINETEKKSKISELIKDKLSIQPKLSGCPDEIIDLEEGVTKPNAVKQLVEKFFQHVGKKAAKHTVELDVIEVGSQGQIIKETVSMNVDEEEEPAMLETPGAKLQKLREELQEQMAQKRLELWKQKHEQGDCLVNQKKEDYEETVEKDILDDEEEEFEMTESESEEEEEEEVEEKPSAKSVFLDNEAEEDEEDNAAEEIEDNEEVNDEIDEDVKDETDKADDNKSPKKRKLRRILKPFCVDSDDEEEAVDSTSVIKYYQTDEDNIIPPNLPRVGDTPQRPQTQKDTSEFEFLTPVSYLTGIQNSLNSGTKGLKISSISPLCAPATPEKDTSNTQIPKKLFPMEPTQNSQNIENLAELCSGRFPETQDQNPSEENQPPTENPQEESQQSAQNPPDSEENLPSTQDLLNLCSGGFTTLPQDATFRKPEPKEIKNLDEEQEQIISQLLDEDELERFKKRFESPVNAPAPKPPVSEEKEVNATGLINSDDENDTLEVTIKKRKKLVFSDEDSDQDDESVKEEEEVIDLHDSDDEEQQLENEIIAQESNNFQLADFLEKEAELSESEWGSEDEDEKGLDEFEAEQADQEKFNENKLRNELERMHMRQILDDDNREVKILQELLLEDGELHGTGRKRQFRWKTLDSDNNEFEKRADDDIFLDEEESEEQFRKMRHKREMFLKKKATTEEEDDFNDSQILKIGQKIFRSKTGSQSSTPVNKTTLDAKEPFNLLSKKGSFLARGDEVLQRLAEYNKVTTTVINKTKNSKSFVFQTVENETLGVSNKRKAAEGTPQMVKKLRLDKDKISPSMAKKNPNKSSRVKNLFGKGW